MQFVPEGTALASMLIGWVISHAAAAVSHSVATLERFAHSVVQSDFVTHLIYLECIPALRWMSLVEICRHSFEMTLGLQRHILLNQN